MPGLSDDPEKRANQLAALRAGRRTLATRELADPDARKESAATREVAELAERVGAYFAALLEHGLSREEALAVAIAHGPLLAAGGK